MLRGRALVAALVLASLATAPAIAHKGKKHGAAAAAVQAPQSVAAPTGLAHQGSAAGSGSNEVAAEAPKSFVARLIDWLGRLHPFVVHFPMAFLPAALFTAIVGRRRPGFAAPVQFLVVAGGSIALLSAVLGWFNAGFTSATDDGLLQAHRWLGTALGIISLALAVWAARRPDWDRSSGMIVALSTITIAIVAQGWLGGALVHGADHLNW